MERVVSREIIARQAEAAAQASGRGLEVLNPYCEHLQPEHHLEWDERFKGYVQATSAPEGQGGV